MDTINTRIDRVLGRSFSELKQIHINYISGTDEFKDFNFEGSRLNVLMSALAYSTYYMQTYANFAVRESFLQTAKKLSSAIIAAQDDGYVPRGPRGARTSLDVTLTNDEEPLFFTIPRGTLFSASILDTNYTFVSMADRSSERLFDGTYRMNIPVVQGELVSRFRTMSDATREFVIRDTKADTTSIVVYVNGVRWNYVDTSIGQRSASQVWYMRWSEDQFPIIYFGNGNISGGVESGLGGLRPPNGAEIEIEYIRTDMEAANGAKNFSAITSFDNVEFVSVLDSGESEPNYVGAYGGSQFESLQSIQSNAFSFRAAQRRCVTAEDYESIILRQFGNFISSIRVTGSSENPGFAFINIKPASGLVSSPAIRTDIEKFVSGLNVFTVTPRVVDPTYMFIIHDIDVDYDITLASGDEGAVRQNIIEGISRYYRDDVESFGRSFHISRLLAAIDRSDNSIFGSSASIKLIQELSDDGAIEVFRGSFFGNTIRPDSLVSTSWRFISDELGDNNENLEYQVKLMSVDNGTIILGPFSEFEAIQVPEYDTDMDGRWFAVGQVDPISSNYVFSLTSTGLNRARFVAGNYTITVEPVNADIYSDRGVIIAYDFTLRPQYTNLNLTPVVPRR